MHFPLVFVKKACFNTASGKHCCNQPWALVIVRIFLASFNTASGKHCCNSTIFFMIFWLATSAVSIPQAVSTVATNEVWWRVRIHYPSFNTASGKHCCNVYKPLDANIRLAGFNTASGKHCCNLKKIKQLGIEYDVVSIPQAVSTVATLQTIQELCINIAEKFQYRKR